MSCSSSAKIRLEDLLSDFAQNASPLHTSRMDASKTFDGAVQVLKLYAERCHRISSSNFTILLQKALKTYTGRTRTKDDLWVLMLCLKDLQSFGPEPSKKLLNFPGTDLTGTLRCKKSTQLWLEEFRSFGPERIEKLLNFPDMDVMRTLRHKKSTKLLKSSSASSTLENCLQGDISLFPKVRKVDFESQTIKGFGNVRAGSGRAIDFRYKSKHAYINNKKGNGQFKALVVDGKVTFIRFHIWKTLWTCIKKVGIAGFVVQWDLDFEKKPSNYIFSKIFQHGSTEMIDWALSLIESGDIRVSLSSTCSGFVPSSLEEDEDKSMRITRPLRGSYLNGKRFLFNPQSKDLFWEPTDAPYLMKVIILGNGRNNTFERMKEVDVIEYQELRKCVVCNIEKDFV